MHVVTCGLRTILRRILVTLATAIEQKRPLEDGSAAVRRVAGRSGASWVEACVTNAPPAPTPHWPSQSGLRASSATSRSTMTTTCNCVTAHSMSWPTPTAT
jgi:hypothetical protein